MGRFTSLVLLAAALPAWAGPESPLDRARAEATARRVTEADRLYREAIDQRRAAVAKGPAGAKPGLALAATLREYARFLNDLHRFRDADAALAEAAGLLAMALKAGDADAVRAEAIEVAMTRTRGWTAAAWSAAVRESLAEEYRLRQEHSASRPGDRARWVAWLECGDKYAHALFNGGRPAEAAAVLDECQAAARKSAGDPAALRPTGLLANTRALTLKETGRFEEADRAYADALAALRRAADLEPGSARARRSVISVVRNRAFIQEELERPDAGGEWLAEAAALEQDLPPGEPENEQLWQEVSRVGQLGSAGLPVGPGAKDPVARDVLRRRAADHPDAPGLQVELLLALVADAARPLGANDPGGIDAVKEVAAVAAGLRARHPDVPLYRLMDGSSRIALGAVLDARGESARAAALRAEGARELEELAHDHPNEPGFRKQAAEMCTVLAMIDLQAGRADTAAAWQRAATGHARKLCERFPDAPQFRKMWAQSGTLAAWNQFQGRLFAEAEEGFRAVLPVWDDLARRHPDVPYFRVALARAYETLAEIGDNLPGRQADARTAIDQALAVRVGTVRAFPAELRFRTQLALTYVQGGRLATNADDPAGAVAAYTKAIEVVEALAEADPKDAAHRRRLAEALRSRGAAYGRMGRSAEFTRDFDRADELRRSGGDGKP